MKTKRSSNQQGFTIIELMIATAVFSVILLMVSVMLISIGNLYYKGVNKSRIQTTARSIAADVIGEIQDSGATPIAGTQLQVPDPNNGSAPHLTINAYCIGTTRYSFIADEQLGTQLNHVLYRDNSATANVCQAIDITQVTPKNTDGTDLSGGTELMAPNSELTDFAIDTSSAPYGISLSLAYGSYSELTPNADPTQDTCMPGSGNQYCATTYVKTSALPRLPSPGTN